MHLAASSRIFASQRQYSNGRPPKVRMACLGPGIYLAVAMVCTTQKLVDTPCHFNTGSRHGIIDQYQFFGRW